MRWLTWLIEPLACRCLDFLPFSGSSYGIYHHHYESNEATWRCQLKRYFAIIDVIVWLYHRGSDGWQGSYTLFLSRQNNHILLAGMLFPIRCLYNHPFSIPPKTGMYNNHLPDVVTIRSLGVNISTVMVIRSSIYHKHTKPSWQLGVILGILNFIRCFRYDSEENHSSISDQSARFRS